MSLISELEHAVSVAGSARFEPVSGLRSGWSVGQMSRLEKANVSIRGMNKMEAAAV